MCPYQLPYILQENAHQVICAHASQGSNSYIIHIEKPKFAIFQSAK